MVADILNRNQVAGSHAGARNCSVTGELFFASTNEQFHPFNYCEEVGLVIP